MALDTTPAAQHRLVTRSDFDGLVYVLHDESAQGLVGLLSLVASKSVKERATIAQKARTYVATFKTWDDFRNDDLGLSAARK